ncbi:MAG: glycosyltransferase [Myxococcaceae bacterium]|nr:glycosyltransferase [Myxococcaceae bacterium]
MARLLIATVPISGHVQPFVAVARALVARGHDVHWYTGQKYRDTVERTGAVFEPYRQAPEFDDQQMERSFPGRAQRAGLRQLKFDLIHVFGAACPGQLADLEQLAARLGPELLLSDPLLLGALLFKQRHGTPLVVINVVASSVSSRDTAPFGLGIAPSRAWFAPFLNGALQLLTREVVLRDLQAHWKRLHRELGLSTPGFFTDGPLVADLFLQPTVAGFEYPRSDLPAHVKLVGALHGEPPHTLGGRAWLAELDPSLPWVHVTQGTMSNAAPTLIAPALAALAHEPVQVVVATGGRSARELGLGEVPKNARIVPLVSYPELLPRTAVMVTNGGYGGVQLALSHGVPLVVWGTSEDKPETAARIAWSGVGVRLRGSSPPRPATLRKAVREVLDNPRYRQRARQLAREYQEADALACTLWWVESLLAPVSE